MDSSTTVPEVKIAPSTTAPITSTTETVDKDVPLGSIPQSRKASRPLAFATWLILLSFSFCTSGVVFGWPALVLILNDEGVYAELCEDSRLDCEARKVRLSLVFSAGIFCLLGGRFFWGLLLDRHGPRVTSFLSALLIIIGAAMFGASMSTTGLDLYIPAYALIGLGGPGIHLANFHSSNLFPAMKRTVIASFSGVFGTSGLVFVVFRAAYSAGISPGVIWAAYAALTMCIAIGYLVVQPRRIFAIGEGLAAGSCCALMVVKSSNGQVSSKASGRSLSIREAVTNWKMIGLGVYFAISFLHLQFYLGQAEDILDKLGDKEYGNVYLMVFSIIGSSALAIFYPVGQLLDKCGFEVAFSVSLILAIAFNVISLVDSLPLQVLGFVCWCVSRMILFACFFSFIPATVGFLRFGVTAGVLSTASALLGLLNIVLTQISVTHSHKHVMVAFLVALLPLFAFPALLRRSGAKEAAVTAKVQKDVEVGSAAKMKTGEELEEVSI